MSKSCGGMPWTFRRGWSAGFLCTNDNFEFQVGNGALAGIAGVSMSFPLDLIKTKFQLNKAEYKGKFINAARGEMTFIRIA